MNRNEALILATNLAGEDSQTAFANGIRLLRGDHPEILLPAARQLATKYPSDARMHQLHGLAARAAQHSGEACGAFGIAARLAPGDPLIAHSQARSALEAGWNSLALFEKAAALAPQDGSVLLGLAAARLHDQSPQAAVEMLDALIEANPLWIDGHRDLARVRAQLGLDPDASLSQALRQHPSEAELHFLKIAIALEAANPEHAQLAIQEAKSRLGENPRLTLLEAHAYSELGNVTKADRLFATLEGGQSIAVASLYARHLLRAGQPDRATLLLEPLVAEDYDHLLWPYLSLAWRLTGSAEWAQQEGDDSFVGVYDLADRIKDLEGLIDHVRRLHFGTAQPLDQSVRGGTQTDGNLLLREDAAVKELRSLIVETVEHHVAQLPPHIGPHPTRIQDRSPIRFSGSWSVRLQDAGFHTDHVHSKGWVSSALYLALPPTVTDGSSGRCEPHAGWLSLGESRDLVPQLEPLRLIQPKVGRLVLFPSSMWHGTRPFPSGERMTIAFDIARPTQDQSGN